MHIRKVQEERGNSELELKSKVWAGDKYLESMGEVAQREFCRERLDIERANTKY